jgi:hypothetical protein
MASNTDMADSDHERGLTPQKTASRVQSNPDAVASASQPIMDRPTRPGLAIPGRTQSFTLPRQHSSLENHTHHHNEIPEVALVNNKHVVPDWLFARGGRMTKRDLDKYKNWQTSEGLTAGSLDDASPEPSRRLQRDRSHRRAPDSDFPSTFSPLSTSTSTDAVLHPPPGSPSSIATIIFAIFSLAIFRPPSSAPFNLHPQLAREIHCWFWTAVTSGTKMSHSTTLRRHWFDNSSHQAQRPHLQYDIKADA